MAACASRIGLELALLTGSAVEAGVNLNDLDFNAIGDLDLVCRVRRMDRRVFERIVGITSAVAVSGVPVRVETRCGPLPAPEGVPGLRVHLLLHDRSSWRNLSIVTKLRYELLDRVLIGNAGGDLSSGRAGAPDWIGAQIGGELDGLVVGLAEGVVPVSSWRFEPAPALVREWRPVEGRAGREKLLRHAQGVLRGAALAVLSNGQGERDGDLARELIACAGAVADGDVDAALARLRSARVRLGSSADHG